MKAAQCTLGSKKLDSLGMKIPASSTLGGLLSMCTRDLDQPSQRKLAQANLKGDNIWACRFLGIFNIIWLTLFNHYFLVVVFLLLELFIKQTALPKLFSITARTHLKYSNPKSWLCSTITGQLWFKRNVKQTISVLRFGDTKMFVNGKVSELTRFWCS